MRPIPDQSIRDWLRDTQDAIVSDNASYHEYDPVFASRPQVVALIITVKEIIDDETFTDDDRHSILNLLAGVKSTNDLTMRGATALIKKIYGKAFFSFEC